jgi:serine phosphatase RsbU (regulator of sigma subunit)
MAFISFVFSIIGDYKRSLKVFGRAVLLSFYPTSAGSQLTPIMTMICCLNIAKLYFSSPLWKRAWFRLVFLWCRRVLKIYSVNAEDFAAHKYQFVLGLDHYIHSRSESQILLTLTNAMDLAKQKRFTADEAIISEFLGKYLLDKGLHKLAQVPLERSYKAYERWGLKHKLIEIEAYLVSVEAEPSRTTKHSQGKHHTFSGASENLIDNATMIKSAAALFQEIHLPELKKVLLQLTVENAGAREAALLWREAQDEPLRIIAHRNRSGVVDLEPQMEASMILSRSVIQTVERNGKSLILADIEHDDVWQSEASLKDRGVKSLLCMPIGVMGDRCKGILYLENDLLSRAFTSEGVQVLHILAGQIAIALENAILYEKLSHSLAAEQNARQQEQEAHKAYVAAEEARRNLQDGLEAAEAVQKSLILVQASSSSYRLSYLYEPAENTGGDWLSTFHDKDRDWIYLCLGDVTGHGIASALVTAAVAGAAGSAVQRLAKHPMNEIGAAVRSIAAAMNAAVINTGGPTGRYMTMAIIGIDLKTGFTHYLNAGHLPIILIDTKTKTLIAGGDPLGLSHKEDFGQKSFQLEVGDELFLYSDGLVANRDKDGKCLSARQLKQLIAGQDDPDALIQRLSPVVKKFARDELMDDTACIAFQWQGGV